MALPHPAILEITSMTPEASKLQVSFASEALTRYFFPSRFLLRETFNYVFINKRSAGFLAFVVSWRFLSGVLDPHYKWERKKITPEHSNTTSFSMLCSLICRNIPGPLASTYCTGYDLCMPPKLLIQPWGEE